MKVEIWSDIMCPFCYIGKRRFENALQGFPGIKDVEVVWKSFQLDPDMKTDPGKSINEYLADKKGWTIDYAKEMSALVTNMAKEVGLHFDFEKAVVANSFDAQRLIQLAKANGKANEMEERLFKAYFTEGKNIADRITLISLGTDIGLISETIKNVLDSNEYADHLEQDIYEAQQIGVRGVPYFVLNNRYAVSGAQASETFSGALTKAYGEWEKEKPAPNEIGGDETILCTPEGECH